MVALMGVAGEEGEGVGTEGIWVGAISLLVLGLCFLGRGDCVGRAGGG